MPSSQFRGKPGRCNSRHKDWFIAATTHRRRPLFVQRNLLRRSRIGDAESSERDPAEMNLEKRADCGEGRTQGHLGPVKQPAVIWIGELKCFDAAPNPAAD